MGNPNNQDLYGIIKQIILEETLFLRHYIGQVYSVSDTLRKGRVQVTLKELGWETPDMAIWAWPRQGNGVSIPAVNAWVEVYFIGGDPHRPVYLFPVSEMQNQVPSKFDGQAGTHVLFQDPNKAENYIKFDAAQNLYDAFGKLKIDVNKVSRVSQLTYRANQFNFTTVRRDESEIAHVTIQL